MNNKLYTFNKRGSKMIIDSGFKEFNKQTNYISSGNVIANTQYSNYIRPYNEQNCNGNFFEKGHLMQYDLKYFNISNHLKDFIKELNKTIILYEIFIYRKHEKDVIGWIIQDAETEKILYSTLDYKYKMNYTKRFYALDLVKKIIEK